MYSGRITEESSFGEDPLQGREAKKDERNAVFSQNFSIANIYREIVNSRSESFKDAVIFFINLTARLFSES